MDTYSYSLLSFDIFFPNTRPDSVARAGTLTYIHTYVFKPMSTTVDRAIASFVRRRLGLATGRPDLIFLKLWSLDHSTVGLRLSYISLLLLHSYALYHRAYRRTCCAPLRRRLGSFLALESDSNGGRASKCEADALSGTLEAKAFALHRDKIKLRHHRIFRLSNESFVSRTWSCFLHVSCLIAI